MMEDGIERCSVAGLDTRGLERLPLKHMFGVFLSARLLGVFKMYKTFS